MPPRETNAATPAVRTVIHLLLSGIELRRSVGPDANHYRQTILHTGHPGSKPIREELPINRDRIVREGVLGQRRGACPKLCRQLCHMGLRERGHELERLK